MSDIKAYLKKIGSAGGKAAAENMTAAERSARAKKANAAQYGALNTTEFIRNQIRARKDIGTTPAELKALATAAGLRHHAAWPYVALLRLKTAGEIVKRQGKYYPAKGKK